MAQPTARRSAGRGHGAHGAGPGIEVGEGALEQGARAGEALQGLADAQAGASQAGARRVLADAEDRGDLEAGEALPEEQLEDHLRLEGDASERGEEQALLLLGADQSAGPGAEVDHRDLVDIIVLVLRAGAIEGAQEVMSDTEEKGAEVRQPAEAVGALDADQEGALHEVGDIILADLVAKEAVDRPEVADKQAIAGLGVAGTPGGEQGVVVLGRGGHGGDANTGTPRVATGHPRIADERGDRPGRRTRMAEPSEPEPGAGTAAEQGVRAGPGVATTRGEESLDPRVMARMAGLRQAMFGVPAEPVRLGRFVLLETLGVGGMGVVYAANDPLLGRRIALKVVKPDPETTASDQTRLLREAQAMARLSHPNVVQIHEVGVWEERVFIAMELVEGQTLAAWLQASTRSWRDIVATFIEAGKGLQGAHRVGVVHRDFKPENVLCGADGRVRVTDFGLARGELETERDPLGHAPGDALAGLAAASLTTSGAIAGTPAYMAPELFLGRPATAASDQFSFCVALYHSLYGVRPFAGADRGALMQAVTGGELELPARSRIPRRIHRALVRGLATAPAERFPSMAALLAAIEPPSRLGTASVAASIVAGGLGGLALLVMGLASLWADPPRPSERMLAEIAPCARSLQVFDQGDTETPYRVPIGCETIHVKAWGGGGGGSMFTGGGGGYAEAVLRVTPGQELVVAVGGGGASWRKGNVPERTGGAAGGSGGYAGASSGGYSGVFAGSKRLLIAGGGGGAGVSGQGGGGGGLRGEDGGPYTSSAAHGGMQEAAGRGGFSYHGASPGADGAGMRGGVGGASPESRPGDGEIGVGGGGGGAGYYGGGGGGGDSWGATKDGQAGGGGGGSGFIDEARALAGTGVLLTATRQLVPRAEDAWGAGRGGDAREPTTAWLAHLARREATLGRPGRVVITTGMP